MIENLLYYIDFYIIPGMVIFGVIMMHFHLRRGKINLAKRAALTLPMLLSYWAWLKFLIPYYMHNPWYSLVIFLVTGAFVFYLHLLSELYPD